jgi:hypothetical protein
MIHPCSNEETHDTEPTEGMVVGLRAEEYTICGDEGVGQQHMYWTKLDATQCFGLSEPQKKCSRSTSGKHHCLVGEEWDALRERVGFVETVNPKRTLTVEVGNWPTSALTAAIARILLEETMNFKVGLGTLQPHPQPRMPTNARFECRLSLFGLQVSLGASDMLPPKRVQRTVPGRESNCMVWLKRVQVRSVARIGTFGVYERVARHHNFLALEAWESVQYENSVSYYVWDNVCSHPFVALTDNAEVNQKVRDGHPCTTRRFPGWARHIDQGLSGWVRATWWSSQVHYAIDSLELPVQPAEELVDYTLAIREEALQSIALGSFGWVRLSHSS